jgi:hypothetical protein
LGPTHKDREAQEEMARLNGIGDDADGLELRTQLRQHKGGAPVQKKPTLNPLAFFAASFVLMLVVSALIRLMLVVGECVRDCVWSSLGLGGGDGSDEEKGGLVPVMAASLEDNDDDFNGGYAGGTIRGRYGGSGRAQDTSQDTVASVSIGGRTSIPSMLRQGEVVRVEQAAQSEEDGGASRLEGDAMSGLMMA